VVGGKRAVVGCGRWRGCALPVALGIQGGLGRRIYRRWRVVALRVDVPVHLPVVGRHRLLEQGTHRTGGSEGRLDPDGPGLTQRVGARRLPRFRGAPHRALAWRRRDRLPGDGLAAGGHSPVALPNQECRLFRPPGKHGIASSLSGSPAPATLQSPFDITAGAGWSGAKGILVQSTWEVAGKRAAG